MQENKNKNFHFEDYKEASISLFQKMFGKEMTTKAKSMKLKSIKWDGIEIDCPLILSSYFNIRERFSRRLINYFTEHEYTLLDQYITTVFQYGYQSCFDRNGQHWYNADLVAKKEMVKQEPTRVHKSQLPKNLNIETDKDGFVHGYLALSEGSPTAQFMCCEKVLFECARPFVLASTHLLISYYAFVYTNKSKGEGQACELTIFFNQ